MPSDNNEKQLKRCLEEVVQVIKDTIVQLQPSNISQSDTISINSIVNHMNTFTLNIEDDQVLDELKSKIESVLNAHLPSLSNDFRNYVKSFLSQYDYDSQREQFKNNLTIGILHPLCRGLQGLFESVDALNAAWNGELSTVQQFIENYPSLKNKPGHYGTTLLYSAARNGHLELVKYLIETAKCSVNAQNEQDLGYFLKSAKAASHDYELRSKAASTALHGACYNRRMQIVQYLIEHGADYFIQNQASETPLANIRDEEIRQYFRGYLILGYSKSQTDLPNKPTLDDIRPIVDCIWEYKSLNDINWQRFSSEESEELQKSLILTSDQQFQTEIRLTKSNEIYTISTVQFLQSGQNPDENNNNLDWIRCRGSSILNFDCYSIWQIMLIEHPNAESDVVPSLKIFNIPSAEDITSRLQIHSWYNCDAKTNARIDSAMNNRQKLLQLNLDFLTDRTLLFNLQTFTFADNKGKIKGFIRWIPKLISNREQDKNKIKILDNFSPMTNLIPIPLTTNRLEQAEQENDNNDELSDDENREMEPSTGFTNDLDDDDDLSQKTSKSIDSGVFTITDFEILYLTDGLLKERLLNDENFITNHTTTKKSIVIFIDEVHERSANIDLCLALIARMLKNNQSLISKVKVIISSATLDASVPEIFARIPDVRLKRFEIPLKDTLYPIQDINRPNENILDVVREILAKRDRRDQVLCFVSSTAEVYRCCKLLNELSQNTIVAYPLVQAQSPREQEEALERGSIFFSTTVAETSLTFSSLKYVVDTGLINVSTYGIRSQQAILSEAQAAQIFNKNSIQLNWKRLLKILKQNVFKCFVRLMI